MAVLRTFRYVPARPYFDEILRTEMLPELVTKPGLVDCYLGRQGPDLADRRIVATVWDSRAAMVDALGEDLGTFHPEYLDATTDHHLEIAELALCLRPGGPRPTILRTLRGTAHPGELERYFENVTSGVTLDVAAGHGPSAFYAAPVGGDAFVTLSAWAEWSAIEAATGGDVRRPSATRHPERLASWDVEHWEIVHGDDVRAQPRVPAAIP